MFSLQALLFGDYADLARRCLWSIKNNLSDDVSELRIGLNAVCRETKEVVYSAFRGDCRPVWLYQSPVNVWKYPLMRRMCYDADRPVGAPYLCWFDDDSYFKSSNPRRWGEYLEVLRDYDMIGRIYRRAFQGRMTVAVKDQPWYAGLPWQQDSRRRPAMYFATGGWWVARREILVKWDWPWPELKHNGGDCTLGELFHQQQLRIKNYHHDVAINADEKGRDSTARPRAKHHKLVWSSYDQGRVPDLSHQQFELDITNIGAIHVDGQTSSGHTATKDGRIASADCDSSQQ